MFPFDGLDYVNCHGYNDYKSLCIKAQCPISHERIRQNSTIKEKSTRANISGYEKSVVMLR